MLVTAYELKDPLYYVEKNTTHTEFQDIAFKPNDWFIIQHLIKIFEIFVKPSTKLQGELYITLLIALLYIYKIYNELNTLQELFIQQSNQNTDWVSLLF